MRYLIALGLLLGIGAAPARAATTCTAALTNINFGTIDPRFGGSVSGTLTYSCTTTALAVLGSAAARMCFSIGEGTVGGFGPRRLRNTPGDLLAFDLYTDAGLSAVWGSLAISGYPPAEQTLSYPVPLLGGNGSGSRTVYARVPPNQGWLGAGIYTNSFSGLHTRLTYRYNEVGLFGTASPPASCQTGGAGGADVTAAFPFSATASVAANCAINAVGELDFGTASGLLTTSRDQTSTISMTCTNRAPWKMGLGNGLHAVGNTRRLRLGAGTSYITYELYRNAARTQRWGNDLGGGTDTSNGTGTGTAQGLTVHGRVPIQAPAAAGSYRDTIVVTVTY